ncbi:uncharacterized protein BXZ73DRAFT_100025 [Epithele typhae]|uniref:uncharacterized protein n=1 Tax=Epithele typhae TaxID=378194 RepID=UPI00200848E1|nr:uncharacterized protein BXZ73DRAFT_100025 [Epithele typhae]KAH9937811.1 hypothetical protein BXZ73DRAFT_100025 [Epithele typhae]
MNLGPDRESFINLASPTDALSIPHPLAHSTFNLHLITPPAAGQRASAVCPARKAKSTRWEMEDVRSRSASLMDSDVDIEQMCSGITRPVGGSGALPTVFCEYVVDGRSLAGGWRRVTASAHTVPLEGTFVVSEVGPGAEAQIADGPGPGGGRLKKM